MIQYAIITRDKFIVCDWNQRTEEDYYLKDDLMIENAGKILFEKHEAAQYEFDNIMDTFNNYGEVNELTNQDLYEMKIVEVSINFDYTIIS